MEQAKIDTEKAIGVVKTHFEKVKGADILVAGRKLIDWLDFSVISTKEEDDNFVVVCEILGNTTTARECLEEYFDLLL